VLDELNFDGREASVFAQMRKFKLLRFTIYDLVQRAKVLVFQLVHVWETSNLAVKKLRTAQVKMKRRR
jgi:hypothetical protein